MVVSSTLNTFTPTKRTRRLVLTTIVVTKILKTTVMRIEKKRRKRLNSIPIKDSSLRLHQEWLCLLLLRNRRNFHVKWILYSGHYYEQWWTDASCIHGKKGELVFMMGDSVNNCKYIYKSCFVLESLAFLLIVHLCMSYLFGLANKNGSLLHYLPPPPLSAHWMRLVVSPLKISTL